MPARFVILTLLIIISLVCDIRSYRVYNLPVALAAAAGFLLNFILDGLGGLTDSILAVLLPFILLLVLYALRMLGAGDIKLFCAIGSIMGVRFILKVMAFSFLAGGIMAIIIMLVRGNFKKRLLHIYTYLKICFLSRRFTQYTDFDNKSDGAKFHFTYAITMGCIMNIILAG